MSWGTVGVARVVSTLQAVCALCALCAVGAVGAVGAAVLGAGLVCGAAGTVGAVGAVGGCRATDAVGAVCAGRVCMPAVSWRIQGSGSEVGRGGCWLMGMEGCRKPCGALAVGMRPAVGMGCATTPRACSWAAMCWLYACKPCNAAFSLQAAQ